jgi:hypothetical protein
LLHNVAALIPPNLFTASLTRNEKLKKLKVTLENVSFVHLDYSKSIRPNNGYKKIKISK